MRALSGARVQEFLVGFGGPIPENGIWLDQFRTRCVATFESPAAAAAARRIVDGVKWPPAHGRALAAGFSRQTAAEVAAAPSGAGPAALCTTPAAATGGVRALRARAPTRGMIHMALHLMAWLI